MLLTDFYEVILLFASDHLTFVQLHVYDRIALIFQSVINTFNIKCFITIHLQKQIGLNIFETTWNTGRYVNIGDSK